MTFPLVWAATGGRGARVVVLDTGFDPDRSSARPVAVRSFIGTDSRDVMGHGTLVAEVVCGRSPLRQGVAPKAELYIAKIMHTQVRAWEDIGSALDWAIELKADVVNMSFAYGDAQAAVSRRLQALDEAGAICLAAYNYSLPMPHTLPSVVSVGTLETAGDCDVQTLGRRNLPGLESFKGTSVATAVMAGVAACAKASEPAIDRASFLERIRQTATSARIGG